MADFNASAQNSYKNDAQKNAPLFGTGMLGMGDFFIHEEWRNTALSGVAALRQTLEGLMGAAQKTLSVFEQQTQATQAKTSVLVQTSLEKAIDHHSTTVKGVLDLMNGLANVRSAEDAMSVHLSFLKQQSDALQNHIQHVVSLMQEFGSITGEAAKENVAKATEVHTKAAVVIVEATKDAMKNVENAAVHAANQPANDKASDIRQDVKPERQNERQNDRQNEKQKVAQ
jgi:hypothetical protein